MIKKTFTIAMLSALFLTSCKETPKQEAVETVQETVEEAAQEIVNSVLTDKEGKKLDVTYNNTNNTATVSFNGETIELKQDSAASGSSYKNENYTLTEWHGVTKLEKDGKIVFEAGEEVFPGAVKTLTSNDGKAKLVILTAEDEEISLNFNDETIVLKSKKTASGQAYANDNYEFIEWHGTTTLKKDGKVVFEAGEEVMPK